jgi:SAM-dependent methyltransferase
MSGGASHDLLDVGIGTGVSARPFREAGCRVLGVEIDARMAAYARADGFDVEVAKFEDWGAGGRMFDLVIAGTTWHWVQPRAGAAKAAEVLRPAGRLALFWNVGRPPAQLARAFSAVYERVLPDTPFADMPSDPLAAYEQILRRAADEIGLVGAFDEPQRWQYDWQHSYTTDQWLDQVPTFGGHSRFAPAALEALLDGVGAAIDRIGGSFTMSYATVAITASRQPDSTDPARDVRRVKEAGE